MSVVLTCEQFRSDERFKAHRSKWEDDALLQPVIDAAHAMWSEELAGARYPAIVAYQTAQLCATGWTGAPASKTRTTNETPYDRILDILTAGMVHTPIVIGCP
jgi:hypothetical protein